MSCDALQQKHQVFLSQGVLSALQYRVVSDASIDVEAGVGAAGFILYQGDEIQHVHLWTIPAINDITCAEAEALCWALKWCRSYGVKTLECHFDSMDLVKKVKALSGRESKGLREVIKVIRKEIKGYDEVNLLCVGRFNIEGIHQLARQLMRNIRDGI